ncbi:MAG: malate dehydrogenase [Chloroflexi bacterium]|nr:MAG: malate dehydrogenase [Chloroflexota bacterium]
MRRKISVIGAGKTGATTAQRLAERNYADIVLFDVVEGLAEGEALDLLESGPILGFDSNVTGVTVKDGAGYEQLAGSDIVVMTAGIARKPGMSRDDLVTTNQKIMHGWAEAIKQHAPNAILIVLSNPVDAITQYAWHVTQFPRERVIGQAGVLDSARFRTFLALELGVSVQNVDAYVLGAHGDSMVPLPRYTTAAGIPVTELIAPERLAQIVQRTRDGGAEIVKLLKTGSAFYAPSAAIAEMVDAIMLDKQKIVPCTVLLQGEYGMHGVFAGVPVRLGARGAEQVVEWNLNDQEQAGLAKSVAAVQELLKVMGI